MKALIIEDELHAQKNMVNLLAANFPDIEVVGILDSVKASLAWLEARPEEADVIFMDVELSDGTCFQIFDKADIRAHVIMTTAYDSYAVKAFEVNSLDYLLKPIEAADLRRAVSRARNAVAETPVPTPPGGVSPHRHKFLIRLNDRIVPVSTQAVAYFYSEAKNSYIVTVDGVSYVLDDSLDTIAESLDPTKFFRISRSCIVAEEAVESIAKLLGGRLRLSLRGGIPVHADLTVSRSRTEAFLEWIGR